jgi:hypothetical protein
MTIMQKAFQRKENTLCSVTQLSAVDQRNFILPKFAIEIKLGHIDFILSKGSYYLKFFC